MRLVSTSLLMAAALCTTVTAFAQPKRHRTQSAPAPVADVPRTVLPSASDTEIRRGLRMEAFIDPEVRISSKDSLFNGGITPTRGFLLNDAAIYVSKDIGKASAFIDLPFFTSDSASNNFTFAQQRAQAYLTFDVAAVAVKFGQFDSPFGVEANDSRDRFFADMGIVRQYVLPKTYTGAQVNYVLEQSTKMTFRGQVSNPKDRGTMGAENPEFGGQFRLDGNNFYGAFGLSMHESKAAATDKTNMLLDIMGGWRQDKLRIDGEFDITKVAGSSKTGNAFYVFAGYETSPELTLGGRFEYAKDVIVGANLFENAFAFNFGPSYKYAEDLTLRADVSFGSFKPANVSEESVFSVGGSAVFTL